METQMSGQPLPLNPEIINCINYFVVIKTLRILFSSAVLATDRIKTTQYTNTVI